MCRELVAHDLAHKLLSYRLLREAKVRIQGFIDQRLISGNSLCSAAVEKDTNEGKALAGRRL